LRRQISFLNAVDNRRLRYFVQIVDSGSITRAAAAAGVAQPALSQQLAILENDLKVKLLDRSVSGVTPTHAGRVLYARAQRLLRQCDELRLAVHREAQPLSGTVVLGVSPAIVLRLGLPLAERICLHHPEVHLQLIEEGSNSLREMLVNARIELAISPAQPDGDLIIGEQLLTERLILAYPVAWTNVQNASLAEVAKLPWVLPRQRHSIRMLAEAVFATLGLTPRVVLEIDSVHSAIDSVRRNLGLTVLPESMVTEAVAKGVICTRDFANPPVMRPMFLLRRRTPALTATAQFVHDLARDVARDLQPPSTSH
jgi:LysR family nitrogen assimilation transcriptional regulator